MTLGSSTYFTKNVFQAIIFFLIIIIGASFFFGSYEKLNFITIFSLALFGCVLLFSLYKKKYFYLSLAFVILFFPSAVNNIFPSYATSAGIGQFRLVSIINHIDIFILFNLVRYKYSKIHVNSLLLISSLLILSISILINLIYIDNTSQLKMLAQGTYNIRYLLYFSFIPLKEVLLYKKEIGLSIFWGILFIMLESMIYTFLNGNARLASGSLATNTFGNILAALFVLVLFSKTLLDYKKKLVIIIVLVIGILLTGNRTSLFVLVIVCLVVVLINTQARRYLIYVILGFGIILASIFTLNVDLSRYNVQEIIDNIDVSSESGIEVQRLGITSSLYSRFLLYETSIEMIKDKPLIGIGSGTWNDKKALYGFSSNVLIDSHNSYLTILSQFGLLSFIYIFLIYLMPSIEYFKKKNAHSFINELNIVVFFFLFAAFFNSDINKYQIAAFLSFIAVMNLQKNEF